MASLNPFVENNKKRINEFLNNLCDVGDFYDNLEMDQYMTLSKRDFKINITLNELYVTQDYLLKHIDTLVSRRHPVEIRWPFLVLTLPSSLFSSRPRATSITFVSASTSSAPLPCKYLGRRTARSTCPSSRGGRRLCRTSPRSSCRTTT